MKILKQSSQESICTGGISAVSDTPTENTRQALDKQEIPVTLITTHLEHEQEKKYDPSKASDRS